MMLGNKGMGYFLSNCPALPNGLWGEYQQLVLPSEIVYIVENILKDQRFFNHVFQWERVKNCCNPSTIIHGNEWDKYKKIIAYSPIHQQFKVEDLDLLQVIKWQLLEKHQADVQTANQVGQLINKACLEEIKQYGLVEYQKLFDWLNKVEFLSQSNNYQLNSRLLDVNSGDDDEKLLSAFAPDEYVLNQQYGNTGKDFFYACRSSKLGREEERLIEWEERLIEWILTITADSKRLAAIRYLEYLRIVDDSLFSRLLSRLKEVDWLQELFPPDQGTDVTRETDEVDASVDKRGQDGTGNPEWGDPGEALAKLFYDHIYLANYSYNLVRKGGYNCNHDFLLCVDGREIEIEVKTIASKSFRLSISEWKELVSKNDCYELLIVEHSGSDISKVIRIQNAWDTIQNALAKLDSANLTSETILSKNIESLIGLQQDNLQKGKPKNVVVVNWDRLVNIYGQGSNDENITFYSCNLHSAGYLGQKIIFLG